MTDKRLRLDCDCQDSGHSVVFDVIDEPDWHVVLVSVEDHWMSPRGIWGRLLAAWVMFWKGEYCRGEVILTTADLRDLQRWCVGRVIEADEKASAAALGEKGQGVGA